MIRVELLSLSPCDSACWQLPFWCVVSLHDSKHLVNPDEGFFAEPDPNVRAHARALILSPCISQQYIYQRYLQV